MQPASPKTRYADLTRRQALLILILTTATMAWCLLVALFGQPTATAPSQGGSDLHLYRSIVEHVHAGEDYYTAAGRELRAYGYPTGSTFNWRPPLYAWLIGSLPTPTWAQIMVGIGALVMMLLAYAVMQREGGTWRAVVCVLLMLGAFLWCVDGDAFLAQELWSGMLIALSVCVYAQGRWRIGVIAGLFAIFFRELALPYGLVCLVLAWRQRRFGEVAVWLVGLATYGLFLLLHSMEVARHITPADRVPGSWIQFGGTAFILTTCRMNCFLFAAPAWVTAIYLPLSLLGLAGWRGQAATRIVPTVGAYLAAFAVVGQPFNNYWGLMFAPLLPFGFVWAPTALRDLYMATRKQGAQNEECRLQHDCPAS